MRLRARPSIEPCSGSSPRSTRLLVAACASLLVVGASTVGFGLGVTGANAELIRAKNSTKILAKDPLSKPSSVVPESASAFANGKFVLRSATSATQVYAPTFDATGTQLSAISEAVDVSLPTPATLAGLNCRAGATPDNRYALLVSGKGHWLVGKSVLPNNTVLKSGAVKVPSSGTFHLRLECSGPQEPGATGTVTVKFFVNGKKVATVTDATSALPVVLPAAVGFEVDHLGSASFSNLTVAQL
jgi:hypothetical protein